MSAIGIMRPALVVCLILGSGASLTACQKKAVSDATGFGALESPPTRAEDKFGKGFGKAFRAPADSEPLNVAESDLIPVSNTTEPEQID